MVIKESNRKNSRQSSRVKEIKKIESVVDNEFCIRNEKGFYKCHTCGEYSIREITEKRKLSFWTNEEKANLLICRKCLAFSVEYKKIYTIDPMKKKRYFSYYVYPGNLKKWIDRWSKLSKETFSSLKDVKKVEERQKGTQYYSIITGDEEEILCPERRLKGWIENIKNQGTKNFLFSYEMDKYGETLLKKIFPIWKNSFVEKSLKVVESKKKPSSNMSEEKIRKIFREEFKKILVLLSSNYES